MAAVRTARRRRRAQPQAIFSLDDVRDDPNTAKPGPLVGCSADDSQPVNARFAQFARIFFVQLQGQYERKDGKVGKDLFLTWEWNGQAYCIDAGFVKICTFGVQKEGAVSTVEYILGTVFMEAVLDRKRLAFCPNGFHKQGHTGMNTFSATLRSCHEDGSRLRHPVVSRLRILRHTPKKRMRDLSDTFKSKFARRRQFTFHSTRDLARVVNKL